MHNANELASIPLAHSVQLTENYENMKLLLHILKYQEQNWLICCDLKVIELLLGLQGGYTKYFCFLFFWDSRADVLHYKQKDWPKRTNFSPSCNNMIHVSLVDNQRVLLPPLHIKLGLMKSYVKALNKEGNAFKYLDIRFPYISEAKLKADIFVGPQIRELLSLGQPKTCSKKCGLSA